MKALIDGTEFEGSPEEIRRFMALREPPVQTPLIPAWRRPKGTGARQKILRAAKERRKTPLAILREINEGFVGLPQARVELEEPAPVQEQQTGDEEKFPELPFADKKLAFQVFRRAATLNNTLNFSGDGFVLGVETFEAWKIFCENVLMHSEEIAEAIRYVPKLTHVGRGITVSFSEAKR